MCQKRTRNRDYDQNWLIFPRETGGLSTSILLTDLYELTMLQAYFEQRMNGTAVFELFVRKLPPHRNFLVAAGLEQALAYLAELRFAAEDLDWLAQSGRFTPAFIASVADLRFTGDVDAI